VRYKLLAETYAIRPRHLELLGQKRPAYQAELVRRHEIYYLLPKAPRWQQALLSEIATRRRSETPLDCHISAYRRKESVGWLFLRATKQALGGNLRHPTPLFNQEARKKGRQVQKDSQIGFENRLYI